MAEIKTKATQQDPREFLNSIEPEQKRKDSLVLLEMFEKATGEKAVMWGSSIVGFGKFHYKSERSRQEGDWPLVGFSPRKQNLTLYIIPLGNFDKSIFEGLGKYKTSVSCLYINKLADVNVDLLPGLIKLAYDETKKRYPNG